MFSWGKNLEETMRNDLPAFNKMVRDQDIPAVMVKPKSKAR